MMSTVTHRWTKRRLEEHHGRPAHRIDAKGMPLPHKYKEDASTSNGHRSKRLAVLHETPRASQ